MNPSVSTPAVKLLVIGYGNTLRSDDGVGPRVAEEMEKLHLPGVRSLCCALLTPELAEPISQAGTVVFVDASLVAPDRVCAAPLNPAESAQIMAHAADPRTLLALARDVFGAAPRAWWLTIPASNLEIGESLSPKAQAGLAEALTSLQKLACLPG